MLKTILKSLIVILITSQTVFSQWENDGKGLNYKQLYGCQDTTGVRLDSMFRMTDSTGKLTICLSIGDLIDIINNYGGDGGDGGDGSNFGCDSVEICLEDGLLCDILKGFPTGNFTSGNRLFGVDNGGMCKRLDIMNLNGVGDTTRVVNNSNGSYSHFNENNIEKIFGYHLVCKNDSTLVLTDWDGTRIDSCEFSTTGGGGNGNYSLDCDSVKLCLEGGILCEVLSGLDEKNTEAGDKYVTIKDGVCYLTDSIYIDICGILDQIQEESDLREDDIMFIQRAGECFKVPWGLLSTDCISLTMESGDLRADIITDPAPPSPYRKVYCGENGLYADSATVDCEQLRNGFPAGTYDSNDHILTFDGTTDECEWISIPKQGRINCDTIEGIFNTIETDIDTVLGFKNGNCVRGSLGDYLKCGSPLPNWDGDCVNPRVMVQCTAGGATPNTCMTMSCADLATYCAEFMMADFLPESEQKLNEMVDKRLTNLLKYNPSQIQIKEYPTVENMGLKSFKSKRQAEISDEVPIGGLYYIEGKGSLYVKTRNRK